MEIEIQNCNNIKKGNITIEENCLNIKYGMNGTGKSTIAKAIKNKDNLISLQTFGENVEPKTIVSKNLKNVLIFNNEFINNIVFKGSEVIQNAFEVFIKSENYDQKREKINQILKILNTETFKNEEMKEFNDAIINISLKIQLNSKSDGVKRNPAFKSIIQKENMYEIQKALNKYTDFLSDTEKNIAWVDWKTKGFEYDNKKKCPFCAEKLTEDYNDEKQKFSETYTKANIKNLNDVRENIEQMKKYLKEQKYDKLMECIKTNVDEDEIELIFQKFMIEVNFLISKFQKIQEFDSYKIKNNDIGTLGERVKSLKISKQELDYFESTNVQNIIDDINNKVDNILKEITVLQSEVAKINTFIESEIRNSKSDINSFLKTAGFNYEFDIEVNDEKNSRTVLIYKGEKDINVENIDEHLSWGERNAFALVLFMYYSLNQKSDLIILDDPISSFDSNKKYAIINRLFENRKDQKSLYGKDVLMLTHDFEPIIDFIINNKPNSGHAIAKYIKNTKGIINEKEINKEKDIISILELCYKYAISDINVISRINFLRKYIEHINFEKMEEKNIAYDILSSIIHGKLKPTKKINRDKEIELTEEEINKGETYIKGFIKDFNYKNIVEEKYTKESLINQFFEESNNYIKSQIFRTYLEITDERDDIEDDNLLKFIDEIYHIENDYIFSLDLIVFDTIPDYIMTKIEAYMKNELDKQKN